MPKRFGMPALIRRYRATFSQREKDTPSGFSLIWATLVIDRPYSWDHLEFLDVRSSDFLERK